MPWLSPRRSSFEFERDQPLVDVVELLDERIDARLVERQRLHVGHDLFGQLLGAALLRRRQRARLGAAADDGVLQAAELLVVRSDAVEGRENRRLDLRLHGGKREIVLVIVVLVCIHVVGKRLFLLVALAFLRGGRRGLGRRRSGLRRIAVLDHRPARRRGRDRRRLGVGAGVGRLKVDDVAQEHVAGVQLVAPDDDRLEGQRVLAEPRDHGLAAGLDALGDGDLALARQKLHRAHLAQVHAHRIVGAVGSLSALCLLGDGGAGRRHQLAAFRFLFGLFVRGFRLALVGLVGLDDVDPHVGEHRHRVFDLLGGDFFGGKHGVQLVDGDVAALLRLLDHLLDRGIG